MKLGLGLGLVNSYKRPTSNPIIIYSTLDPVSAFRCLLSNGNLSFSPNVDIGSSYYAVARVTSAKNTGKYYVECNQTETSIPGTNLRIGVVLDSDSLSVVSANMATKFIGVNGSTGGLCSCAVDIDAGKVWVRNISQVGWNGGGDPVLGTLPTKTFTPGAVVRFAIAPYRKEGGSYGDDVDEGTMKINPDSWFMSAPSGFNNGWSD